MKHRQVAQIFFFILIIHPFILRAQSSEDSVLLKVKADFAFDALYGNLDSAKLVAKEVYELAKQKNIFIYEMDALSTFAYAHYYNYEFDTALSIFQMGYEQTIQRKDSTIQAKYCNAIAMVYEQMSDYKNALVFYKESINIDMFLEDSIGLGISLGNMANVYHGMGEVDSAIACQIRAIVIREGRNDAKVHSNYNNLGTYYHGLGRYDLAIDLYLKAAKIRKELKEYNLEAQTYGNLSVLFSELKDHDNCILYNEKSKVVFERENDQAGLAHANANLGAEYFRIKEYDKALKFHELALEGRRKVNSISGEATDLHNIGTVYDDLHQYNKALNYYQKSLAIKNEIGKTEAAIITTIHIGNILSQQKEYKKAEKMMLKAYRSSVEGSNLTNQRLASEKLSDHYERVGNYKKSLKFKNIESSLKDSIFNEDYTSKMNQLYVAFETSRTKQELLEEQLKSKEFEEKNVLAELEISNRNNQLIAAISGILLILLIGGFVFYRNKQKEKSKLAQIRIDEQQKGFKAVINATEEERKRIAKDLHDGIVQQLGGLKLGLQKIFSNVESTESNKLMKVLDDSADELRELSHRIMPKALSELGLIPALEDMLDNSLGNTNINFEFEHFGIEGRLKENVEIAIYRISQELINNVTKHSKADKVNIQLFKSGNNTVLIVEDNGKGFDVSGKKSGIGLMNISSRVDTVNGKVNFEPSPESGTLVTIKIPIE